MGGARQSVHSRKAVVPPKFFYSQDGKLPVAKIIVTGYEFEGQNEPLATRMQHAMAILEDLFDGFSVSENQEALAEETNPDRITEMIRRVQCEVLPQHGFDITPDMTALEHMR